MSLKLRIEYVCYSGEIVQMAVDILGLEWGDACSLVSDAGICGENGSGFALIDLGYIEENYDGYILKVLREIKKDNPEVDCFSVVDDFFSF